MQSREIIPQAGGFTTLHLEKPGEGVISSGINHDNLKKPVNHVNNVSENVTVKLCGVSVYRTSTSTSVWNMLLVWDYR